MWQALPIARLPLPHPAPSPAPGHGAEGLRDAQGPVLGIFSIFLENADGAASKSVGPFPECRGASALVDRRHA